MGTLLLVRHGQASFGADDYDQLSELGYEQAREAGVALGKRGIVPSLIVAGGLKRQQQTAATLIEGAGWATAVDTDEGWNEFDHIGLVAAQHDPADEARLRADKIAFQNALELGMHAWIGGADAPESYADFSRRTAAGLARVVERLGSGETGVVVSSAGVIAQVVCDILGAGGAQWIALNRVGFNAGITTLATGRSGVTLLTYNEATHLAPEVRTFR